MDEGPLSVSKAHRYDSGSEPPPMNPFPAPWFQAFCLLPFSRHRGGTIKVNECSCSYFSPLMRTRFTIPPPFSVSARYEFHNMRRPIRQPSDLLCSAQRLFCKTVHETPPYPGSDIRPSTPETSYRLLAEGVPVTPEERALTLSF